jgi:hypothetical protein
MSRFVPNHKSADGCTPYRIKHLEIKKQDMIEDTRAILTKKFLMSLPEGVFIMSSLMDAPGQPTCFESVSSAAEREKQWERIVSSGCNNRFCSVFKNEKEVMDYLSSLRYKGSPSPEPPERPGPRLKEQTRTTLTKKFFMGLPKGVFIVSNLGAPEQPECAEYVLSPASEREKQWERIVLRGCSNRLCWVFKNEEEAMAFFSPRKFKESPPPEPPKGPGPKLKVIK